MKGVNSRLDDQVVSTKRLHIEDQNSSWREDLSLLDIFLKVQFYGITDNTQMSPNYTMFCIYQLLCGQKSVCSLIPHIPNHLTIAHQTESPLKRHV